MPAQPNPRSNALRLSIVLCVLCLALGVYEYIDLGRMEAEGRRQSMLALEAMLYDFFGRTGVLVFFLLAGTFWLVNIVRLLKQKK